MVRYVSDTEAPSQQQGKKEKLIDARVWRCVGLLFTVAWIECVILLLDFSMKYGLFTGWGGCLLYAAHTLQNYTIFLTIHLHLYGWRLCVFVFFLGFSILFPVSLHAPLNRIFVDGCQQSIIIHLREWHHKSYTYALRTRKSLRLENYPKKQILTVIFEILEKYSQNRGILWRFSCNIHWYRMFWWTFAWLIDNLSSYRCTHREIFTDYQKFLEKWHIKPKKCT